MLRLAKLRGMHALAQADAGMCHDSKPPGFRLPRISHPLVWCYLSCHMLDPPRTLDLMEANTHVYCRLLQGAVLLPLPQRHHRLSQHLV